MFAVVATLLLGSGPVIAMYWSRSFSKGAWHKGVTLFVFAGPGRTIAQHECRKKLHNMSLLRTGGPQCAFSP